MTFQLKPVCRYVLPSLTIFLACLWQGNTGAQVKQRSFDVTSVAPGQIKEVVSSFEKNNSANTFSIYPIDNLKPLPSQAHELTLYKEGDNLQVLFDKFPSWFVPRDVDPALLTLAQQFLTNLSKEQQEAILNRKSINVAEMKSTDLTTLQKILLFDNTPNSGSIPENVSILINDKNSKLRIRLIPELFVSDGKSLIGAIHFSDVDNAEASTVSDGVLDNQPDWTRFPELIIPSIPENLDEGIILDINKESWTIGELAEFIEKTTNISIKSDALLSSQKFYISEGKWKLPRLVKAMSIGLGIEFRSLKGSLYIALSPAHRSISTLVFREKRYLDAERFINTFLQPRYRLTQNKSLIKPFQPDQFESTDFVPLSSLSPEQIDFIKGKIKPLPEEAEVRFITELTFILSNEKTNSSISTYALYGAPTTHRSTTMKTTFQSEYFFEQYKATVIN